MKLEKLNDTKILFIVFLGIAIFLRIINITSEQLWIDEGGSISYAKSSLNIFWTRIINDIHPPLYYVILKGWIFIWGDSVASCRLLSAIFSILTLPILYFIGKEIKDERLGLIIIFLYSISPFSIYYANEVRSYSLIHLLFTISLYFAIKCIKTPNISKNYTFIGIIGTLLIYTHYIGIIYLVGLFLGIFIINKRHKSVYKNIFISTLIIALSYIPWVPFAINDALGGAAGYTGGRLNLINLSYYLFCYFLAPVPSNINDPYILNLIILILLINIPLIIISLVSIIGFLYSHKNKDYIDLKNIIYFIIFILVFIFGITITVGFLIPNTFTAKNLIGGLSIVYIIEGLGLYYLLYDKNFSFFKNSQKFLKIFTPQILKKLIYPIIIILLINNIIIYPIFRATYLQKPDWNGCVKRLKKDFKKHDIIINSYHRQIPDVMKYYSDLNDFDLEDNSIELNYDEDDIEEFFDDISDDDITRIWILSYWSNLKDSEEKTEDFLIDDYNLTKIEEYEFRNDIILTLYEIP
jgi:uncharacterized membrane protein